MSRRADEDLCTDSQFRLRNVVLAESSVRNSVVEQLIPFVGQPQRGQMDSSSKEPISHNTRPPQSKYKNIFTMHPSPIENSNPGPVINSSILKIINALANSVSW